MPEVVAGHGSPEMEEVATRCPWWWPVAVALEDERERERERERVGRRN